jgi:hypothetical protein
VPCAAARSRVRRSLEHGADGETVTHDDGLEALLRASRGVDCRSAVDSSTWRWCLELGSGLPERIWVHEDEPSLLAAQRLGCPAFTRRNHIYLGAVAPALREHVLRHELVHVAQVALSTRTGHVAPRAFVEDEAERLARAPKPGRVRFGADPEQCHAVWWVAIGVGLYVLLRPGVANAPGPRSTLIKSPTLPQIVFESLALFAVPGGAMALGGRFGIGFLGRMALGGAAGNVSLRGVDDVFRGAASPPLLYLFDAGTGAIVGFVVPGGFRLVGRAGTFAFDELATLGVVRADIAIARKLAEAAAVQPLNAEAAQVILQQQGLGGRVSTWWLDRRGLMVLYRGQSSATTEILSPLAREQGVAASRAMVTRMQQLGLSDREIAGFTAKWHTQPIPDFFAPPGLGGFPLGSVGIPTTRLPGIAANFGEDGVIYILRVPKDMAIVPLGWQGLQLESEFIILNSVPSGSIVKVIPASRIAPIMVDDSGLLVPGAGVP